MYAGSTDVFFGDKLKQRPPAAAELLFAIFSAPAMRETALGCATERYARDLQSRGWAWAASLYWVDALRSLPTALIAFLAKKLGID